MGVLTEYQAVITCDVCGDNLVEALYSQKNAIKEARKLRWTVGKTVKCNKCIRKEKEVALNEPTSRLQS